MLQPAKKVCSRKRLPWKIYGQRTIPKIILQFAPVGVNIEYKIVNNFVEGAGKNVPKSLGECRLKDVLRL